MEFKTLLDHRYIQNKFNYSLFNKIDGNKKVCLLIQGDDLLISGSDMQLIDDLKVILHSHFKIKDLGNPRYLLGLEVDQLSEIIVLNQRKYALQLISESGLTTMTSVPTPMICSNS